MTSITPEIHGKTTFGENDMEFLLKELELHIDWEARLSDRVEQIGQTYLTVITAILGGGILIIQAADNYTIVGSTIFAGSLLILAFGIFSLNRLLGYRQGIARNRMNLYLLRRAFLDIGIKSALLTMEEKPPRLGFTPRAITYLTLFAAFCSFLFSITIIMGISTILYLVEGMVFKIDFNHALIYILSSTIGFTVCFSLCRSMIKHQEVETESKLTSKLKRIEEAFPSSEKVNEKAEVI